MNPGLFSNRNSQRDFVKNAFLTLSDPPCNVFIAVAFFTDASVIEELVACKCPIRLIVRLGFPTSPQALEYVMRMGANVEMRYFTDHSFHPKLYIFGTRAALVGSANLTSSALTSNQEVVVSIDNDDSRLNELAVLFAEYWNESNVLTQEVLQNYRTICDKHAELWKREHSFDADIKTLIGVVTGSNITRDHAKKSKENLFLEDFRKNYQEGVTAFNIIRRVYESYGMRKASPPDAIPLRLEIDSFISFVREKHAFVDEWQKTSVVSGQVQEKRIAELVAEWHQTSWPYFENDILKDKYPRLIRIFKDANTIKTATDEDLFEALTVAHSFGDRFRFYLGGAETQRKEFLAANKPATVRENLAYLLYGPGKTEERMANLIYNPDYKLNEIGQANVQELVGWLNKDELPVINSRTTKVLRYLGFQVRQLS